MREINLFQLVLEVDDELILNGIQPFQRPFHANLNIIKRLGLNSIDILNNPISVEVNKIYSELYRPTDLHMPPMHIGAFMFRDVFFSVRIPVAYGRVEFNPINLLVDASEKQKEWIFSNKQTGLTFLDQFIDLEDFVYGFDDVSKQESLNEKTLVWWLKAKQQLEAAAAIILGSFDKDAIVQNCCIAVELLLKGVLIQNGITEEELSNRKKYSHNLEKLVIKSTDFLSNIDKNTILFVIKTFPDYVKNRYEANKLSRSELGTILMYAQYVAGEVLRQFSDRNCRLSFIAENNDWSVTQRTFPKKRN